MGTMSNGYYYNRGKRVGYDITAGVSPHRMHFSHVSYHSKGRLIAELVHHGYKKEDMEIHRSINEDYGK